MRNIEVTTILVEQIQNVNWEENNCSFLDKACEAGNASIVQSLLARGALLRPDHPDVLEIAAKRGHLEVVRLILNWNADTERVSLVRVKTALKFASKYGYINIVQCLVEYGTDVGALTSALYHTIEGNRVEVAAYLLDNGADYNVVGATILAARPVYESTPWIYACSRGSLEMVQLLLDRGADPDAVDAKGLSPLRATNLRVLKLLLEHGADPNLADTTTGETLLMRAALNRHIHIVDALLEHGGDVNQENSKGKTVLDMLGDEKYRAVRELCTGYIECNKPGAEPVLK